MDLSKCAFFRSKWFVQIRWSLSIHEHIWNLTAECYIYSWSALYGASENIYHRKIKMSFSWSSIDINYININLMCNFNVHLSCRFISISVDYKLLRVRWISSLGAVNHVCVSVARGKCNRGCTGHDELLAQKLVDSFLSNQVSIKAKVLKSNCSRCAQNVKARVLISINCEFRSMKIKICIGLKT